MAERENVASPDQAAREEAVKRILAGEVSMQAVAEKFGITRQAVSLWVKRYRETGNLQPRKRGRRKLPVLSEREKYEFYLEVKKRYEARGFREGDHIPNSRRLTEEEICEILSEMTGENCTIRYGRRMAIELRVPTHYPPLPGLPDDYEFEDDNVILRNPLERLKEEMEAEEEDALLPPPPLHPPGPGMEAQEDDELLPRSIEDYEKWVEETRAMVAADRAHRAKGGAQPPPPGVRTGKHAKGKSRPKRSRRRGRRR